MGFYEYLKSLDWGVLEWAILTFVLMESSNVFILYFCPEFQYGNGVYVFEHWEKSKKQEEVHLFARYMANWVAGVKLIFIVLLVVILFMGNAATKIGACAVMVLSIATYYWRLHPIMKKLDELGEIKPKGYSKTLWCMITGFMLLFSSALIVHFAQFYGYL